MGKRTLAIIGGGAVGTLALHDVLMQYEDRLQKHESVPRLDLAWYDAQGRFVSTDAFAVTLPDSFRLNGPAYMVRPSGIARKMFYDFYRASHPDANLDEYIPRRIYGEFLRDLTRKLEDKAQQLGVPLNMISQPIVKISQQSADAFKLIDGSGRPHQAGKLIIATGPAKNPAMQHLQGLHGYVDNPADPASYARAGVDFKNSATSVIAFGLGGSFFDSVTILEQELGFRGQYVLVESHPHKPWVITREKDLPEDVYYKFTHFAPDKLPCPLTLTDLQTAFQKDIDDLGPTESNPLRYGIEHPLYYIAAFAMLYFQGWEKHHSPEPAARKQALDAFEDLQKLTSDQLKDVVSPQALDLYNTAIAEGRVRFIKGRVLPNHIHRTPNNLVVPVALQGGGIDMIHGTALINGMPQQGDWQHVKDGILPHMRENNLIRLDTSGTTALYDFAHALKKGIGLTGAAVDSIWGVHIFANKTGIAANELVRQMTGFK